MNLRATGVSQADITKVFLSHLHSDHIADLASLYVGRIFGRRVPWEVRGMAAASSLLLARAFRAFRRRGPKRGEARGVPSLLRGRFDCPTACVNKQASC